MRNQETLEKRLEKLGFKRSEWNTRRNVPSLTNSKDNSSLVYPILVKFIEDYGPVFSAELANVLVDYFSDYPTQILIDLPVVGKYYGIKEKNIGDVLKSSYGKFSKIHAISDKWDIQIKPSIKILYLSEESLEKFIKENTRKREEIVIDFI